MSDAVLQSVTDKERKRQEAIFELLTSERHYVDSLKLVKQVFFDPMAEQQVLTEEEMVKASYQLTNHYGSFYMLYSVTKRLSLSCF